MALSQTQISQLYVAIFNRASEGEGNSYWQAFDSAPEVATAMLATPDAQQYFGSSIDTNQAFIETIYLNTLNKTPADDQAGIDYWVGQLDSGASRGQVVSDLVAAVESYADSTDPATARAYNQFTNRVEVSNYTADNLQEAPDDYATSLNFGAGLIVTDDDATVASAQTKVDVASGEFMLVADAASVNEGESVSFTLSNGTPNTEYAYKVEGNGAVGEVAAVTTDANGSATITVAASDVLGADAPFSVSIIGEGLSSEVTAVAVNDAPELTGDAAITGAGTEDAAVTVAASDLLAGYTDEEGDTLSVANVVADNGATVTDDGNGTYTIEPAADFNGEVTVSYDVTDGTDATAASWTVDFAAVNDAPTTSDATAAATEAGNAVEGQLVAEDVDGDDLSFTLDAAVDGLTLNADGSYSFDPSANTAVQALTYKDDPLDVVANYTVDDGNGGTAQGTLTIAVEPTPLTFTLEQSTAKVEEGSVVEYTIVASEPVQEDFAGEIQIALEAGDTASLEDFGSGSFNPQPVTIAAGETTSTVATITPKNDAATELPETFTATATVAGFVVEDIQTTVQDPSSVGGLGQTFTLTTGVDEIPGLVGSAGSTGTDGNDTIVGTVNGTNSTLSALDNINGGLGTDVLKVNDVAPTATAAGIDLSIATISNVETLTVQSVNDVDSDAAGAALDTTAVAGLETLNVIKGKAVWVKAADTTAINVSGTTGNISVAGGKDITVNDETAGNAITVGNGAAGGDAAGAITITDTDNAGTAGADDISVEGGTDVTVTATADKASGKIVVGDATNGMATGAVNVTQNLESDGEAALNNTAGGIAVTGGTSITINSNATSDAKDEDSDAAITMHDIAATGSEDTTEVTVTQTKAINTVSTPAEDEVKATHTVTFKALNAGQTTILNGLTFTASENLSAAEVAQAFANLTVDDTQLETGPTANGFYSGAFDGVPGWTSGAADGAKVVFTAPASGTTTKMVAGGDVAADVTAAIVAGSAAVAKDESLNDITYGDVNVDDHAGTADATITTVTLDGFDDAVLGRTNSLDALTTLSLANGKSAELNTTQSALDLTVNNISSDLDLDGNGGAINITDLNITTVGADSTIIFTATAVTDLTIDAAVDLDASGSAFDALENVTIAGAGAVILDGTTDDTLATIDAANNEGGVTATVKGNVVVTGGDGNDTIEVSNDTITKAINLGAGDDTLTLAPLTTAGKISATVDGGDGDDTLAMGSADAEANSTDTDFDNAVTGFEMLYINDAAGTTEATDVVTTTTINLANLAYSNVITSGMNIGVGADTSLGTADDVRDKLVLDNLASDGMVVLTGDGDIEVNVADAADGTADNLDLVVANTQGSVTANNVETINIDAVAGDSTFALTADSVETISITGFEFVNLTDADSYWAASATPAVGTSTITSGTLTMIDASGMTDAGSVPVGGIAAATSLAEQTIKGSIGADYLTAADSKAVIEGGDGADTIFVTDGATSAVIDGGAGADTFDITGAALGVEAFATFNNVDAGDKFLLNASSFSSDEVAMTLDDPSTSDYINAAFNQTTAGEAIWFQHNNNTYIVDNQGSAGFDAADVVVKLTGLVDLSAASFNDAGTLEVA